MKTRVAISEKVLRLGHSSSSNPTRTQWSSFQMADDPVSLMGAFVSRDRRHA